ncbi:HAD family hydrolase [Mycobacterium xenopi]|uniref:HAD family hydrolase n=1 Tax=Mycobacterium xenopi TaxID=1789 RepID=UPI0022EA50C5|nr:HAD family hydrolase [Mycobacterium xenopi]MDA3658361.1 HAD family hydrolase [Mycobacterium xenopi]
MATSTVDAPAVLFDVDGTLVDSNFHHAVTWHRAFLDVGQGVACWRIHGLVGRPGSELVRILLGDELADACGDEAQRVHGRYFGELEPVLRALPGTRDLLEAIASRGWRTVLASSASVQTLELLRRVLDVDDLVCDVTSSVDVDRGKPDPDIVVSALHRVQADPARSLFVGDSVWDVEAGRRAGVPTVAVLCGGVAREALEQAGAAAIYADPADIHTHFDEFSRLLPA